MNTISGSKTVSIRTVLAVAAMLGLSAPVAAQDTAPQLDLMGCSGLQAGSQGELMFACAGHPGCGLVLRQIQTCDKAQEFIARLDQSLAGRKKITGYDVFEAAAPPVTGDPEYSAAAEALQQAYHRQSDIVTKVSVTEKGDSLFYEGPMKGNKRHGIGISISSRYSLWRAEFVDGRQIGTGEWTSFPYPDGSRYVGEMKNMSFRQGRGVVRTDKGHRYSGAHADGNYHGQGTFTTPDGRKFVGEMREGLPFNGTVADKNGKVFAVFKNGARQPTQ